MVVVCKYLVPKGYQGITLFPFIILRSVESKGDRYLLNHERIHLRQQAELFVVFFYLWYGIEFCWHWVKVRHVRQAYKKISFEKEAYKYEQNVNYLEIRKMFSFIKELK